MHLRLEGYSTGHPVGYGIEGIFSVVRGKSSISTLSEYPTALGISWLLSGAKPPDKAAFRHLSDFLAMHPVNAPERIL
jgi:hypothetical protein